MDGLCHFPHKVRFNGELLETSQAGANAVIHGAITVAAVKHEIFHIYCNIYASHVRAISVSSNTLFV